MLSVKKITALDAVAVNATSGLMYVGNYKKVGIKLKRTNHTSGNGAFAFHGGLGEAGDTPTLSLLNTVIDNVTNSNVQNLTRVQTKTLSANGESMLWLSPETPVTHLVVTVVRTTDGTHTAELYGFC